MQNKITQNKSRCRSSAFLLFFEAHIEMSLELFGLFMDSFKDFVRIGVDVEVHFLVVMGAELSGVACQLIVYDVVVFQVPGLAGDNVYHEVANGRLAGCVLDVNR